MRKDPNSFGRIAVCLGFFVATLFSGSAAERVRVVRTPNNGAVPDAEIDQNGTVHVAFVAGQDAFYVTSVDSGKTFNAPVRINSEASSVHPPNMFRGPDIALGKGGRVHVIWYGNGYQRKLPPDQWGVFYSYLEPKQEAFTPSRNLNHKPSDNFSVAANANGDVAVIWMAKNLFVNMSRDNGETFGDAEAVAVADPCECCASRAFFSKNGTLYIDYREKANNMRDMHLLTRAKDDATFSKRKISTTPWQVNACPMAGTFLAGAKTGLIMAWETKGQIFYARFDPAAGLLQPKEIKAAAKGKWPVALAAPDGSTLVSWKNGSTLAWQLYDTADQPIGVAESKPSPNANRHAGVVTKEGNFLLID